MDRHPIAAIILAALVGLAVSLALERLLEPRVTLPWRRRVSANCLHAGIWLALFLVEFLQFWRPWLACILANALWFAMILISNVKYRALGEPFVYQDIDYFADMLRHPRLYLPFFGYGKAAGLVAAAAAAITAGIYVEPSLPIIRASFATWLALATIALCVVVLVWCGGRGNLEIALDPLADMQSIGLLAMLWKYRAAESQPASSSGDDSFIAAHTARPWFSGGNHVPPGQRALADTPNVIVVQSESFFDIRRAYPIVCAEVLGEFDSICAESLARGTLEVPARGANTVRTEFSFITGISNSALGIDQFNPYRRLATPETVSIARVFKQRGYKTICVHPYPGSFYRRDRAIPALGFDHFVDIAGFELDGQSIHETDAESNADAQTRGPYVSDADVARKVIETLAQGSTQPLFVFVITMENHGPLHLEKPTAQEQRRWLTQPLPAHCEDLIVYLRHLNNADNMIKSLKGALSVGERPGLLAWYGDHIPIMERVYRQLGEPSSSTDYFLWRSDCGAVDEGRAPTGAIHVEQFASMILKASDQQPDRY